jgi:hypothetical protein
VIAKPVAGVALVELEVLAHGEILGDGAVVGVDVFCNGRAEPDDVLDVAGGYWVLLDYRRDGALVGREGVIEDGVLKEEVGETGLDKGGAVDEVSGRINLDLDARVFEEAEMLSSVVNDVAVVDNVEEVREFKLRFCLGSGIPLSRATESINDNVLGPEVAREGDIVRREDRGGGAVAATSEEMRVSGGGALEG